MTDDSVLIERILAGDTACYAELVQKYQQRLFNTLLHMVGTREDAEDVTQEAFVQAYLKLATFQGHSALYTWLYRIAFNIAITHRRKQRPTHSIDYVREVLGDEPVEKGDGPTQRMEQREQVQQVHLALARVSEEHRAVLVLRELEGLEYDQIAGVLDLPIGTVRSRLHRARLQLKDSLELLASDHAGRTAR